MTFIDAIIASSSCPQQRKERHYETIILIFKLCVLMYLLVHIHSQLSTCIFLDNLIATAQVAINRITYLLNVKIAFEREHLEGVPNYPAIQFSQERYLLESLSKKVWSIGRQFKSHHEIFLDKDEQQKKKFVSCSTCV